MFGPRFEFPHLVDDRAITVVMRPADDIAADAAALARKLQHYPVTQFVMLSGGPTAADEEAFLERIRADKAGYLWVVEVAQGDARRVLGTTGFALTEQRRGCSGIVMCDTDWWNKGITRLTHRLRTWYAFEELNLNALDSCYLSVNEASGKALRGVGYVDAGRRYGLRFTGGRWVDEVLLTAYNPSAHSLFWPNDDVPAVVRQSATRIETALAWARDIARPR
jgi:RimJ/RimL family protein N-acetyltransferase